MELESEETHAEIGKTGPGHQRVCRPSVSGERTKMAGTPKLNDDMREKYDFTGGVRGKYAKRFLEGSNVVVLDPDVAAAFRSARELNEALREELRRRRAEGDE